MVLAGAQEKDFPFMILSGKFGLIEFDQPLPYYDHLLKPFEVLEHSNFVAVQIKEYNITEVEFYTRILEEDPNIQPYLDTISLACKLSKTKLTTFQTTA